MFDMIRGSEIKKEYEEKVNQTAEANFLNKIRQLKGNQASILTRLLDLLRRPHDRLKHEMAPK